MKNFLYSFFIVFTSGAFASYFSRYGVDTWYHQAIISKFTPPDSFFSIIWSIIYILMTISFFKILQISEQGYNTKAKILFVTQLFFQIIWCYTFFYNGWLGVGFGVILLLDYITFATIKSFKSIKAISAYLLYPYLIWLCYASFLNLIFIIDNGFIIYF